jgi:hypothetical protein
MNYLLSCGAGCIGWQKEEFIRKRSFWEEEFEKIFGFKSFPEKILNIQKG